jgi:hypothetical protein
VTIGGMDRATLRQLAEHGDNPAIPRPVVHYFYGEQEPLEILADILELRLQGWSDLQLAKGRNDCRLVATKVTALKDSVFEAMTSEIMQAIERVQQLTDRDIEYDGWETSVEKPS